MCASVRSPRLQMRYILYAISIAAPAMLIGPVYPAPSQPDGFAAQGRVEGASQPIDLGFTISGRVATLNAQEGAPIRKGEALASLECAVEQAQWRAAEAEFESQNEAYRRARRGARNEERDIAMAREHAARAELTDAEGDHSRIENLVNRGNAASRRDLDQATSRMEIARAELVVATRTAALTNAKLLPEEDARWKAQVRNAQEQVRAIAARLEQCTIRAPIDGVLLRRHVLVGEVVSEFAPRPALTVADVSRIRIRTELDERDALRVSIGRLAEVSIPTDVGQKYSGRVSWISPIMGRKTVRGTDGREKSDRDIREVLVDLGSPEPSLPIGIRVVVQFSGEHALSRP
jgi:HlyD family secretion protein